MKREELNQLIARDLLKIKAVFFRPEEPFTWASGIKSPVYCDNRLTLTAPEVRTDVEKGLAQLIGPISWDCLWAMCVPARRTMAGRTRSKAGWSPARRLWLWKT